MKLEIDCSNVPGLREGRFTGQAEWVELIRSTFVTAAVQGWREIIVCDPDFSDWPLGERVVAQALNDWAKMGRQFVMLAENYEELPRRHARFVTWRRTWAHIVECRQTVATPEGGLSSALWSPSWIIERKQPDMLRCVGSASLEVARRVALKERLNELLMHSLTAFPATTLGL